MDKRPGGNPFLNPADQVLKAAAALDADPNFRVIRSWIAACNEAHLHRLPLHKDETELRWMQGQTQTLLLINKTISSPREELLAREQRVKDYGNPRNV